MSDADDFRGFALFTSGNKATDLGRADVQGRDQA